MKKKTATKKLLKRRKFFLAEKWLNQNFFPVNGFSYICRKFMQSVGVDVLKIKQRPLDRWINEEEGKKKEIPEFFCTSNLK